VSHDEPGYLQAFIGGLIGYALAGLLAGCAGFAYFAHQLRDDPYGLPGLGAIVVAVPAALLGEALGCWIALRLAEFQGAFATAGVLAAILALLLALIVRAIVTNQHVEELLIVLLATPLYLPLVARAIVLPATTR
jgi:hypothetical protein